jgi:hypothetical protein
MNDVFLSDLEVCDWGFEEVLKWCAFYGFVEQAVLDNVERYKVTGLDLVDICMCDDLGFKIPLAKTMYDCRLTELQLRHHTEEKRKKNRGKCSTSCPNDVLSTVGMKRERVAEKDTEEDSEEEDEVDSGLDEVEENSTDNSQNESGN